VFLVKYELNLYVQFFTVSVGPCQRSLLGFDSLRWRGPAAIVNYRLGLASERAPHINKPATV
jgi:hypothetical protein